MNAKATDDCGTLLIFAASAARDPAMVQLLLRAGAKVNAQDRWGCTALASACCPLSFQPFRQQFLTQQPAVAARKGLVKRDTKSKGSKSATPKSRQAVIELLIASSADPDLKDQAGLTPLMVATIASEHLIVRTLLSANIARDACDDNGMTALVHATNKGFEGIARLLRQPSSSLRKSNFFSSHSSFLTAPTASPSAIAAADRAAEELLQADRQGSSSQTSGAVAATAKQKKSKRAAVAMPLPTMLSSPRSRRDSGDAAAGDFGGLRDSGMTSPPQRTSAAASAAASAATFFNWAIGRDSSASSSANTSAQGSPNPSADASRDPSRNGSLHAGNAFPQEVGCG